VSQRPKPTRGNIPRRIEQSVEWLSELMRFVREHNLARVVKIASMLLSSQVNSWQIGIIRRLLP
jgi:hypothetical protein